MKDLLPILKELEAARPGVPQYVLIAGIDPNTRLKVLKSLHGVKKQSEVDIVFNSPGGQPADAYRMIKAFRSKFNTVNVIVPFWAKSAATLLALGATRIVMHEFGEFGPIDMQIKKDDDSASFGSWASALSVQSSLEQIEQRSQQRMLETFIKYRSGSKDMVKIGRKQLAEMLLEYSSKFYAPLLEKIDTMEIGVMARYLNIGRMYAMRILTQYTQTPVTERLELLNYLVYECPDHGFVVDETLLKRYLPHVIRADVAPFGSDYYHCLEKLSISLMEDVEWEDRIGFLSSFQQHETLSKVKGDEKPTSKRKKAA